MHECLNARGGERNWRKGSDTIGKGMVGDVGMLSTGVGGHGDGQGHSLHGHRQGMGTVHLNPMHT